MTDFKVLAKIASAGACFSILIIFMFGWMLDVRATSGVQMSGFQQMFLADQRGITWDTIESQTRIDTAFPAERLAQVFSHDLEQLNTYQDWAEEDAPYSSAFTSERFSSFSLALEYRWGERSFEPRLNMPLDSGIIFHAFQNDLRPWPSGIEFQLKQPDHNGELILVRTRAQLVTASGDLAERVGVRKGALKTGTGQTDDLTGWNHVLINIDEDSGELFLNGKLTSGFSNAQYFNPYWRIWRPLKAGRILLQAEGAEVSFRNITLSGLE